MNELILYVGAAALLAGGVLFLLRRSRSAAAAPAGRPESQAEFFPVHCRYFPQVRHALSSEDASYLASRGSPAVYRRWRKSIRRAGRMYLAGLREDFSRLNRLARQVALYSPQVRAGQEAALFRLNLRFELLYGIVVWRFLLGQSVDARLEQMASLIGTLGSRLERATLAPEISSGAITP